MLEKRKINYQWAQKLAETKEKDLEVVPCGLIVSATHGFRATRPGGIVIGISVSFGRGETYFLVFDCNRQTLPDCANRKHIFFFEQGKPIRNSLLTKNTSTT